MSVTPAKAADEEQREPVQSAKWSLSASGGTSIIDGSGDQPIVRIAVTRLFDDAYIRASATRFSTRDGAGIAGAVPASTVQATVGGGIVFGAVSLDGYGAIGWRRFDQEAFRRNTGAMIEIDSQGRTLAGGVSLTYQIDLDQRSVFAPFVAGDLNRIDTARAINVVGRGTIAQKERQSGETISLGATLDRLVGDEGNHRIELYGAFVSTTNSAVATRSSLPTAAARLFGPQDAPGLNDSWVEFGASTSLRVSRQLRIDLSVVRTAGFRSGESTNVSIGARWRI